MSKKKSNQKIKNKQIKKEATPKVSSRVSRNENLYSEDFSITKQQQFDFNNLNMDIDLDLENTLDTSFVDKRSKKINKEKKKPISNQTKTFAQKVEPKIEKNTPEDLKTISKKSKKSKESIIIILIIFILLSVSCLITIQYLISNKEVKEVVKIKEVKVIDDNYVFLGDSITNGYDLEKFYKDMPVVNSGINGNITSDILEAMPKRLYQYNPSKVFILIGTNDINKKISDEEILGNLEEIINKIKENRPLCKIYLQSIYPINKTDDDKINHDMVDKRTNEKIQKLNVKYKELAKKSKITYINMYDELADEDGNLLIDYTIEGLHISEEGYKIITKKLMNYIKK